MWCLYSLTTSSAEVGRKCAASLCNLEVGVELGILGGSRGVGWCGVMG